MIDVEVTKAKERDAGESILNTVEWKERGAERDRWCVGRGDESKMERKAFRRWKEYLLG